MKTPRPALVLLMGLCACDGPSGDDATSPVAHGLISEGDDRIEAYQVLDDQIGRFRHSTGALWLAKLLTDSGGGASTITTQPYTKIGGQPLCPGTKFYGQQVGFGLGCSAFLVAPDMIATAYHCLTEWDWTWDKWKFVLDYQTPGHQGSGGGPVGTLVQGSRIFTPIRMIGSSQYSDWALLQLDRPVDDWRPIYPLDDSPPWKPEYRTQFIDAVASFGHGGGLPLKHSFNAAAFTFREDVFLTYLDVLPGHSGGPIFDTSTGLVRGLLRGQYVDDYRWDAAAKCFRLQSFSPEDAPIMHAAEATYTKPIADLIAPIGGLVEPTYRDAKLSPHGPSAAVTDQGEELLFITASDQRVYMKRRQGWNAWSGWSEVPGPGLSSTPVAVMGLSGELWLFGRDNAGRLVRNLRWSNGSWTNWEVVPTPTTLVSGPGAFAVDGKTTDGRGVRVVAVSILGPNGRGHMQYITYTSGNPWGVSKELSGAWQSGAHALVSNASSAATGFALPGQEGSIATIVDDTRQVGCAKGTIGPGLSVTWSACATSVPSTLGDVRGVQGVTLEGGVSFIFARGTDSTNLYTYRWSSGEAWKPWMSLSGRTFATPAVTRSMGTYWVYTLSADRRVAVW